MSVDPGIVVVAVAAAGAVVGAMSSKRRREAAARMADRFERLPTARSLPASIGPDAAPMSSTAPPPAASPLSARRVRLMARLAERRTTP